MPSASDVLIRAEGLALGYGGPPVLHDVDLAIRAGEYWFLVGPNGSGKTTFVRALFGLVQVVAGRLWIDPERAGRARVGFVPQRWNLNPSLPTTVGEQVSLGLVGLPLHAADRAAAVARALDAVGLGGSERRDLWALSGGQRQRVLLARALIRDPSLLVLDEPEAGLDLAAERRLLDVLREIHGSHGVTLLHVSHDLESVRRYASHVALFAEGAVRSGPVADVITRANVERAFAVTLDSEEPLS
jgi:ABC-type Mn2+/Zn2+ transport system ATPase subunit